MTSVKQFAAPKGATIFQPGQSCPGFVILSEGCIKVTLTGPSGREVVLYRVHPGEVCLQTLSCLVNGEPYTAEGVAETALAGELIPAGDFRGKFAQDTAFRDLVMASITTRFAEYQQLIEDIALTRFDSRLAKTLLKMANSDNIVELTHAELATETASGRAYVTRRLADFARKGWVEQLDHGLVILKARALEQVVDDAR